MTDEIEKPREEIPGGSVDETTPASETRAGDEEEEGGEIVPWHKDPRWIKFQNERKALERDREDLNLRLRDLERERADQRRRPEAELPEIKLPELTPELSEKLGIEPDQLDFLKRYTQGLIEIDRRNMFRAFAKRREQATEAQEKLIKQEREAFRDAEDDFGEKGFGSLKDPSSLLYRRADVIRRSDQALQTPFGLYRAVRMAFNELQDEKASGKVGTTEADKIIGGTTSVGGGPGPKPGFKKVDLETYKKMTPAEQEKYDRASIGLD